MPSRLIAKIYLFRTIFRGSAYAFSVDPDFMGVSTDVAFWEEVGKKFYAKYSGLDKWHTQLSHLSARRKPYISFTGRSWLVEPLLKDDGTTKLLWSSFTNHPVQGTGADIVKLTRIAIHQRLLKYNMKGRMVNTIHDANYVDCPDSEADACVNIMYEASDDIPRMVKQLFNHELSIPFPCEAKKGPDFKNLEKAPRSA